MNISSPSSSKWFNITIYTLAGILLLFLVVGCGVDDSSELYNESSYTSLDEYSDEPNTNDSESSTSTESERGLDPSPVVNSDFYPIMLCNGFAGTDYILAGLVEFMFRIKRTLENAGREVYYAPVPSLNGSQVRSQKIADKMYLVMVEKVINRAIEIKGDDNITEEDKLKVDISNMKFNLICHSHGGINARYLARLLTIPDPRYDEPMGEDTPKWPAAYFVSSITMLSVPNTGTYIAEWIADGAPWPIPELAEVIGKIYEIINLDDPQISSLRAAGREMSEYNMKVNMNPTLFRGVDCSHIRVYNWSASIEKFKYYKINNPFIAVMREINSWDQTPERKKNDGVVCTTSAAWNPTTNDYENAHADENKGMQWDFMGELEGVDHFQLINQILENLFFGWPDWNTRSYYTDHSEFLDNAGL